MIIRAILAGERDPEQLAGLKDCRIQASHAEIVQSLEGTWRPELLFQVKQEMAHYDFCQKQIAECDRELEQHLQTFETKPKAAPAEGATIGKPKRKKKAKGNAPQSFDLAQEQERITGVEVTRLDGIDVMVTQTAISEVGTDMSPWPTEGHFTSWMGICPNNQVSGVSGGRGTEAN